VKAFREKNLMTIETFRERRRGNEYKSEDKYDNLPELDIGDMVRLRTAPDKLPLDYKGHLGFRAEYYDQTVAWGKTIHTVMKKKHYRVNRKWSFFVNNAWFDRYELQKVPEWTDDLEKFERARRARSKTPPGARRSGRIRKKVDYSKYY
jgi:hypothetical protein